MKRENPWKTLASRQVYQNPWIRLREDRVIRPDGEEGIYGVLDTRVATAVVALTPAREIYLVGQYRYPTNHYSWELIEGGTDPGENALETAKRELREEAGLVAGKWIQLGDEIHLSNCITSEVGFLYLAEELTETESEPDGTEVLEIRREPLDVVLAMVDSGEIKDAMSVIGILRADRYLRRR